MSCLEEIRRPVIFAHRGASAHAPENTLAAFRLAVEMGADAIELDAKLTSDGEVVVIHDQTLDRTTGFSGRVNQSSLVELRRLDAGSFFSPKYAGEKIPSLAEVFETVGKQIFINVEITNYASPFDALPVKVVELVRNYNLEDWVLFSSFHPLNLLRTRWMIPQVPVGVLAEKGKPGRWARSFLGRLVSPKIVHPNLSDTDQALILAQHDSGRRVHVWTVDDPVDMRRLFNLKVDGIFTDDPQLALTIREEK
jgi:glycerophosphoryl diester phosphodiesterase